MFGLFKSNAEQNEELKVGAHLKGVNPDEINWKEKTDEYWKKNLTPFQYKVTRKAGTERAFTGRYWDNKEDGIYSCSACGQELFDSKTKYKSGTGWPSFYDAIKKGAVTLKEDRAWGMVRTEVVCSRCDSHLGHVFDDGPKPTGKRYCMNSFALIFQSRKPE